MSDEEVDPNFIVFEKGLRAVIMKWPVQKNI